MRRPLLCGIALVLVAQGCSLGPREAWAEAIRDGFEQGRAAGTARVRQTVTVKVIETNIRQTPKPLIADSTGVVDFDARRARLVENARRQARAVYDDLVVYLTRSTSSVGRSTKRWSRFDFEVEPKVDVDDNDRRLAVGAGLISPALAVEFLEGILTGSVDEVGTGRRGGEQTTKYRARMAPDAVTNEIRDEDRAEGAQRLFETLGVQQDDFPVEVWIDDDGLVRGVRYVMRQQKDRVNAFELSVSWVFFDYGAKAKIDVPSSDISVRPGRFRDLVEDLIREF